MKTFFNFVSVTGAVVAVVLLLCVVATPVMLLYLSHHVTTCG